MKHIPGIDRRQTILFPEVIDEYIEEENPVQFIDVFVDTLDLIELDFSHAELKTTGRPPYNPADLLKLYIYGYLNRIRSSRWLEKECKRNIELMWLLKKLSPDFKTIADFRKDNREAIKRVCREFVLLCKKLDLFGGELVGMDGSKFKAVNSKKKNFNEAKLKKRLKAIEEKINREKVKKRQWLVEHPFGTLKRAFNQGYMLMKGIEKVVGEIGLSILAYNIKRVINIVGLKGLILAL